MKRSQVIMVAAAAIILGLLWFTYTRHREPSYGGRSLSQWLDLCVERSGQSQEAQDAVRLIGTNAVPFLITWVQQDRPLPPRDQLLWDKVSSWKSGTPGRQLLLKLIGGRKLQAERALWGFVILRWSARSAAPDLLRVVTNGNDASASLAADALMYLGRDGHQALLSVVTNTAVPQRRRLQGVIELNQLVDDDPSDLTAVLPEFTILLSDPDASVRSTATNFFQAIAPQLLQQSSAP